MLLIEFENENIDSAFETRDVHAEFCIADDFVCRKVPAKPTCTNTTKIIVRLYFHADSVLLEQHEITIKTFTSHSFVFWFLLNTFYILRTGG